MTYRSEHLIKTDKEPPNHQSQSQSQSQSHIATDGQSVCLGIEPKYGTFESYGRPRPNKRQDRNFQFWDSISD
jgi:hypothetical protein